MLKYKLDEKINKLEKEFNILKSYQNDMFDADELKSLSPEEKQNYLWICPRCNEDSKINSIKAQKNYYYVHPYSCSAGDYHNYDGISLTCPKCDYIINISYKKRILGEYEISADYMQISPFIQYFQELTYFSDHYGICEKAPF